jgi:hypothetical protein
MCTTGPEVGFSPASSGMPTMEDWRRAKKRVADMTRSTSAALQHAQSMRDRENNMNLVAEATNIHGLIAYLVGMILIGGAMTLANYIDDQRDNDEAARKECRGALPDCRGP